jgi:sugar phosphate isomerase/epimerase
MRLGMENFSYHFAFGAGEMDIISFIDRCATLELDGVQLNMAQLEPFLRADAGRIRQVRDRAEALGMFIEIDTRGTDPTHLANMLRLCSDLGADVLRTYASCGGDLAMELAQAGDHLRAVVPLCRELGVRIAFENHEYETSADVLDVLRRVDSEWIGAHVDTGNSMMVWEDPLVAVAAMAPLAVSTHFKDHVVIVDNGEPLIAGVTLGSGSMDCEACFRILAERSPLTRMIIEVCYGYAAPFRRPQSQGAGGRLGEGVFRVVDGPHDPSWIAPRRNAWSADEVQQWIAWQEQSVVRSIEYVKRLNKQIG